MYSCKTKKLYLKIRIVYSSKSTYNKTQKTLAVWRRLIEICNKSCKRLAPDISDIGSFFYLSVLLSNPLIRENVVWIVHNDSLNMLLELIRLSLASWKCCWL